MAQYMYSPYMICVRCNWPWLPKRKAKCERCGTFFSWGKTNKDLPRAWVRDKKRWKTINTTPPRPGDLTHRETLAACIAFGGIYLTGSYTLYVLLKLFVDLFFWYFT